VAGAVAAEPPLPDPPPEPPRPRPRLRRRRPEVAAPSPSSAAGSEREAPAAGEAAGAEISSEADADAAVADRDRPPPEPAPLPDRSLPLGDGPVLSPPAPEAAGSSSVAGRVGFPAGAGAGPDLSVARPGRPGSETCTGPDGSCGSSGSGAAAEPARELPCRERPDVRAAAPESRPPPAGSVSASSGAVSVVTGAEAGRRPPAAARDRRAGSGVSPETRSSVPAEAAGPPEPAARPPAPCEARGSERPCRAGAGEAFSVRSTASAPPSPSVSGALLSVSSLSESVGESADPGPAAAGRRRLRPPREPRRRRLRTTAPSSPPPVGAGAPSPCSGRATATGSSEAGRASGTISSDMETFPRVARQDGAPAPGGRRNRRRGARSRMVGGATGAPIDLVEHRHVTSSERRRSDPPPRRHHTQPSGEQGQGEGRSGGRPGQAAIRKARSATSRRSWSGGPPLRQRGRADNNASAATTRPGEGGGLDRLGQQRFSPRPEGLHHVVASLAVGRGTALVAPGQVRATLAARPTAAKLASIDDPP
jgi:hypothetical protein